MHLFRLPKKFVCDKMVIPVLVLGIIPIVPAPSFSGERNITLGVLLLKVL
jgi:hypothetical protein